MMNELKKELEERMDMKFSDIHDMNTNEKVRRLLNEMGMTVKEFTDRISHLPNYHLSRTHFYELINNPEKMRLLDIQKFSRILQLGQFEACIIFMNNMMF